MADAIFSSDSLPSRIKAVIESLTPAEAEALQFDWEWWARGNQRSPEGDWPIWLILAGRGFGKTRTGAEMVRRWVQDFPFVNLIGIPGQLVNINSQVDICVAEHVERNRSIMCPRVSFEGGRAGAVNPFGYLVKPFEDRALRPAIEMALYHHRAEREREALLAEINRLRLLLPVCAWCRKVKTDDGYWLKLMEYLSERLGASITHGMCGECSRVRQTSPSAT